MDKRLLVALGVLALVILMSRSVYAVKTGAAPSTEPEMIYARGVLSRIYQSFGYLLTLTAGRDGTHMATSKHYEGLAEDYRTRDVQAADLSRIVTAARSTLGPDYQVIVEADHLHVEYDPK